MKKINLLILGGSGFIGQNLVEYFKDKQGYRIFYPTHKKLDLINTAKVSDFIRKNKIEVIINLANIGGTRKTAYDENQTDVVYQNLRIFFNLVRCICQVKSIINIGSGAEYDRSHWHRRMKEDYFDTYVPEDAYGFSKYVCSKYIQQSKKILSLRLFGVFGKHEDYTIKFISNAILKKILGLPIVIYQNAYFDYLYINDLARIIELFIKNKFKDKAYNITPGQRISLLDIANKINCLPGKPTKIIIKNPGLNKEYTADNSRLVSQFPGLNFTPLDESLKELFLWYQKNISLIDKKTLMIDKYKKYAKIAR